jgi:hypothetical protein
VLHPPSRTSLRSIPSGTFFGSGEGYAGFLDTATHGIVRLKTSKGEHGWILRSVTGREAVLEKNEQWWFVWLPLGEIDNENHDGSCLAPLVCGCCSGRRLGGTVSNGNGCSTGKWQSAKR